MSSMETITVGQSYKLEINKFTACSFKVINETSDVVCDTGACSGANISQ